MKAILEVESRSVSPVDLGQLQREILTLKRERHALILAHNYQVGEIQDVADYVGDSLGLSFQAAKTDAEIIVFCGVHFMAETAKIVNPTKKVVMPDVHAGCSLADSCDPDELKRYLSEHPNTYIVAYINCSAAIKALSDIICTSGNAVKVVEHAPRDREILFVPDENLGQWVMEKTGRFMKLWKGFCHAHVMFTHESIMRVRRQYPAAPVVAHPECIKSVRMLADHICSTEGMVKFTREHESESFIIVTEEGMLHRLRKEVPGKTFIPGPTNHCPCNRCEFMKMNTLEKLHVSLRDAAPEVFVEEAVAEQARVPIERMLALGA
jgi:quinolinate synthase